MQELKDKLKDLRIETAEIEEEKKLHKQIKAEEEKIKESKRGILSKTFRNLIGKI